MGKLIAAINMTLDGFCDHTLITPDEEIHQHYAELLDKADVVLYGRITYQLMQFWQTLIKNPYSWRWSPINASVNIKKIAQTIAVLFLSLIQ